MVQRIMLTLSESEYTTLRRVAFERHVPMAKLIRTAIDAMFGTDDREIGPPGRPARAQEDDQ